MGKINRFVPLTPCNLRLLLLLALLALLLRLLLPPSFHRTTVLSSHRHALHAEALGPRFPFGL